MVIKLTIQYILLLFFFGNYVLSHTVLFGKKKIPFILALQFEYLPISLYRALFF